MKSRIHTPTQRVITSSLMVSMLSLTTFGTQALAQQAPAYPPASAPASSAAYTPPSAGQLYQMTAPIALFPDKLVALVLAGATYPDQISAANDLVTQNPDLTGAALVSAADQQPWDPSVKALTEFPAVLSQMSSNMAWTTALGQAYYNDPSDVLNAVQVMRQRAKAAGHLSSNRQIVVMTSPPVVTPQYVPAPDAPLIYDGPPVVAPPPQTIVIEPAQPEVVYVPAYNPAVVYGAPVAYYPGYAYEPPVFAPGVGVTVGLISFGVGIVVGAAMFSHVGWGWHNWGMHWAPPPSYGPSGPGGGWRPSVVYNHTTYISRTSTTIINRYNHYRVVNNYGNRRPSPQQIRMQQMNERQLHAQQMRMHQRSGAAPAMHPATAPAMHPGAFPDARPGRTMTMPQFNANDSHPGPRPAPQSPPNRSMEMHRSGNPPSRNPAPQFQHNGPERAPAAHPQMPRREATPHQSFQPPHVNAPRPAEAHPQRPQPQFHPQQPRPQFHPQRHPQAAPRPAPAAHPAPAQHTEPRRVDEHK
ncbi:DUF3300 domain-containing protein [Bordetella sp. FB-8]|uniref:DUF3300 domain-containing protein n=1 Tax=Bordetella sp. FB-8 TaxID=1159870 RepID=UPI0003A34551|nr:DUF3300 domain-containing protein [Bordetella sp. FB-8]